MSYTFGQILSGVAPFVNKDIFFIDLYFLKQTC